LNNALLVKKRAENTSIKYDGQKDLFVHAAVIKNAGRCKVVFTDAVSVNTIFLLLRVRFFKTAESLCVCGLELCGKWLARSMELVRWAFTESLDLTGIKQHGLCCTNCGLRWYVLAVIA